MLFRMEHSKLWHPEGDAGGGGHGESDKGDSLGGGQGSGKPDDTGGKGAGGKKDDDGGGAGKGADYWETEAKKAFQSRDAMRNQFRTLQTELDELKTRDAERAKAEKAVKEGAQQKELEAEGKYQEALKLKETQHEQAVRALKQKFIDITRKRIVGGELQAALAKVDGILPNAIPEVARLLQDFIRVDEETLDITVVDENGNPMKDPDTLERVTIEQLAAGYVRKRSHYLRAAAPTGSGVKAGDAEKAQMTAKTFAEMVNTNDSKLAELARKDPEQFQKLQQEYLAQQKRGLKEGKHPAGT